MSTGKIAIGLLAFSLTLGLGVAAFAGDPAPRRINAVDLGDDNDVAARRDDAADDLVAVDNGDKDPDDDGDDDGTKGDDGTNGGDNTVDEPSAASLNDDSVDEPSVASVNDDSVDEPSVASVNDDHHDDMNDDHHDGMNDDDDDEGMNDDDDMNDDSNN